MAEIKHVGRLTTNNRKLVVAYRVIPGEPDHCLVIHTESLDAADHDTLLTMVESNAGQTANELSEVMARTQLTDGSNMLQRFHSTGKLVRVPTNIVELTPNRTTAINLAELNQIVADQKGVTIEELGTPDQAPATAETAAVVEDVQPAGGESALDDEALAAQYRSQADSLFKEAKRLREQAEELVPTKKKAKMTESAS
tara:strand:+ start:88 stop:681 length:594 start_codon:yes stop_codon:yes gene_type:complete